MCEKYVVRNYEEEDMYFVEKIDFLLSLQIQFCGDFSKELTYTIEDSEGDICAVVALSYHNSWYTENTTKPHYVVLHVCTEEVSEELYAVAIRKADERMEELKKEKQGMKCGLLVFSEIANISGMQKYLKSGFVFGETVPVLRYDLTKELPACVLDEQYCICEVGKDADTINRYIEATKIANDGVADSLNEYWFRSNDSSFRSYYIADGDTICAGISMWDIGEESGATENIFTIPQYRRKKFATALIAKTLEAIKARGFESATLSMIGSNEKAMKLYQSLGYELDGFLVQLVKW